MKKLIFCASATILFALSHSIAKADYVNGDWGVKEGKLSVIERKTGNTYSCHGDGPKCISYNKNQQTIIVHFPDGHDETFYPALPVGLFPGDIEDASEFETIYGPVYAY